MTLTPLQERLLGVCLVAGIAWICRDLCWFLLTLYYEWFTRVAPR